MWNWLGQRINKIIKQFMTWGKNENYNHLFNLLKLFTIYIKLNLHAKGVTSFVEVCIGSSTIAMRVH
jgi:uncharacterized protein YxeA